MIVQEVEKWLGPYLSYEPQQPVASQSAIPGANGCSCGEEHDLNDLDGRVAIPRAQD